MKRLLTLFLVRLLTLVPVSGCVKGEQKTITAFCGSASKPAMEEAAKVFEQKTGIKVYLNFSGSGTMLSQMKLSRSGDLYIPASPDYMAMAEQDGVVEPNSVKIISYLIPAILVQYGNPKNIQALSDLAKPGIDIDESQCVETNAYDILAQEGKGKKIAIVGHYPFVPRLQSVARKLWVIEKRPREGDFSAEEAINILPQAEVVAISGTSLINHPLENLLNLCHNSFVVIVGPSCPLSPVLFNYGVDVLAGAKVVEAEAVIEGISQGATLRQVKGIKLLAMKR